MILALFRLLLNPNWAALRQFAMSLSLFAYEPQDILDIRNIALAANKQNTFLTPVAAAAYVYRQRNPGTAFASFTPSYYSDEQQAGKGHNWPTVRVRIGTATDFSGTWDVDAFNLAWALGFAMGADTVSGAGPFTHLFKFIQSTNQAPVTTLLFQDTADLIYQLPDLAIADLQITGKESGPLSMQFKAVGSGKRVDGAVALPALTTPSYLLGSDADILIGPPVPDPTTFTLSTVVAGALAAHTAFYKFAWRNALGTTMGSSEVSIAVPANSVSKAVAPAVFPPGVTSCDVYGSSTTGTETFQGNIAAGGGNFQEPNTGFAAGAALPTDTTALTSFKERVVQWTVHIVCDMQPNRAPGGQMLATFMKVLKQRANFQIQIKANSVDDLYTLVNNDTLRQVRIKGNSGAAAQFIFDYPGMCLVAPTAGATGQEVHWPITGGDQDVLKWQGQEVFQATVINNTATFLTGA
jgi:hypothetical protein